MGEEYAFSCMYLKGRVWDRLKLGLENQSWNRLLSISFSNCYRHFVVQTVDVLQLRIGHLERNVVLVTHCVCIYGFLEVPHFRLRINLRKQKNKTFADILHNVRQM